jgi:hypothetical protein
LSRSCLEPFAPAALCPSPLSFSSIIVDLS